MILSMRIPSERWVSMGAVGAALLLLASDIACQKHSPGEAALAPSAEACDLVTADDPSPSAIGKLADLSISLKDMNGADVPFSAYKGKILLINFWATWCAPCKAEIPDFVALQNDYGADIQVLGISVDDTAEDVKPYAEQLKMNYPVLIGLNRRDVETAYGPFLGIPQTFIIARDGTICRKHAGIASKARFESEIKALL
jgi:thiol-disulfide isomerase/thioredoxin